jgi:hypothetical protein
MILPTDINPNKLLWGIQHCRIVDFTNISEAQAMGFDTSAIENPPWGDV